MTTSTSARRDRLGGYQPVPEGEELDLDQGQGQGRGQGRNRRGTPGHLRPEGRYSDNSSAGAGPSRPAGRSGPHNRDRRLPEKPLPALPSIPISMPASFQPGSESGLDLASPRRRPLMLFFCAFGGCLLAGLTLELAWHGVRTPRSRQVWECLGGEGSGHVPQYFQTTPELWPGPTATGRAPFMAQTRVVPTETAFVPNQPLQTQVPIQGMTGQDESIFELMGYLAPYQPAPGFGVEEYGVPEDAEIVQVQMISRHGSRYPTSGSDVARFGQKIENAGTKLKAKGQLAFLNDWKYELGHEILVPKGRSELFESGILHSYMYSQLYNPNSKIIARTTTQDRMLKSAEYFLAGFFGLEWTNNATLEVIIEQDNANNSLAGYLNCPEASNHNGGSEASREWQSKYLANATSRLQGMLEGVDWDVSDTYAAQTMCPYETVAYGYSRFCDLFTYEEWVGFEYAIDLAFSGNNMFQNPTARAVGIGYQQEVMARLKNHTLGYSGSQINTTLDSSEETFPLNQTLYFDFSHDTNMASVLTAFGLRQFADVLPPDEHPGPHNMTVSHVTPFGARLDMEIIKTPRPLRADRSGYEGDEDDRDDDDKAGGGVKGKGKKGGVKQRGENGKKGKGGDGGGGETKYIHFVLNQRTLPLGFSFPECDPARVDGWCELETFMEVQGGMEELADYVHTCHGELDVLPYGSVTDGRPVKAGEGRGQGEEKGGG